MTTENKKEVIEKNQNLIEGINPNGFFSEESIKEGCSVKVAVRIRPLLPKEIAAGDSFCIRSNSTTSTVEMGMGKSFKFDKVFGTETNQQEIFDICVKNLVLSSFAGYNSTILAYGQTGSGKTYTMGTDSVLAITEQQQGIIPKVIKMIFKEVEKRKTRKEFVIKASFIEIYNEEIRDLLDPQGQSKIVIRELVRGIPSLCGQQEELVIDSDGLLKVLEKGAIHRRTRSTIMNENSSRSHAILEINIEQHLITDIENITNGELRAQGEEEQEDFITAKFHFVDLAGSERIKKTGADGELLQEGISINKALFVLGKVINALIDETGKTTYKPYRESNLTRILQDSLGGNARTTMVACVSPADSNHEETLSTLMYACKARSIKNKPVVNVDPHSTLIHQLQQQVYDLQKELSRVKKGPSFAREVLSETSMEKDLKAEAAILKRSNEELKRKVNRMEDWERGKEIEFLQVQKERDIYQIQYEKLKTIASTEYSINVDEFNLNNDEIFLIEKYKQQIIELQEKNRKQQEEIEELRKKYEEESKNSNIQSHELFKVNKELQRTLFKMRKANSKVKQRELVQHLLPKESNTDLWLSTDLNKQLEEVQDVFISELAQSLDTLITDNIKDPEEKVDCEEGEIPEMGNEDPEEDNKEIQAEVEIKEKLNRVDVDIHEREKMLEQIKEKQKEMQKSLISIMKQQYHKKLEVLEKEMEKFKADQEKAMQMAPKSNKQVIEQQYKKKLGEYENKIKDYRRNEANQQKLLRQTNEQGGKIQSLTEEIMKMKQQRLEMNKRMKQEREDYQRNKKEQLKETLRLKKESINQKVMITKLINEKERANRHKEDKDYLKNSLLNISQVKDYRNSIEEITNRLANMRQESMRIRKEWKRKEEINTRLDSKYTKTCQLKLDIEKLQLLKKEYDPSIEYDKIKEVDEKMMQIQQEIEEHQVSIDNLESTLNYYEEKIAKLEKLKIIIKGQLTKYCFIVM